MTDEERTCAFPGCEVVIGPVSAGGTVTAATATIRTTTPTASTGL